MVICYIERFVYRDTTDLSYLNNFEGKKEERAAISEYCIDFLTSSMAGIRRTWDKEYYAQKAKDREEFGDDFVDNLEKDSGASSSTHKKALKEEFKPADSDEEGPVGANKAFIKARDYKLELDHKAGKIEVINPLAEDSAKAGFWCEVCKCLCKDSSSYLDHINGKKRECFLCLRLLLF